MTHSRDERLALAAHLVLRESRPDAAAGVLGGPLAGYTARAQDRLKASKGYAELIEAFRAGPPRFSPFAIPGADGAANTVEYFVHHEDVRRAATSWEPRDLDPALSDALWSRLKGAARMLTRSAPVGIELARAQEMAQEPAEAGATLSRLTVKRTAPMITVTGTPAELTLWLFGRVSGCHVSLDGPKAARQQLQAWRR